MIVYLLVDARRLCHPLISVFAADVDILVLLLLIPDL